MRICLIASSRFPVREPFHGGMEAHTAVLADHLVRRGHDVSVFAAPGSYVNSAVKGLPVAAFEPSVSASNDVAAMPDAWMRDHHAYLSLMMDLARSGCSEFDVVHNNSLHYLPVAMSDLLSLPVVSTLHTPPVAWLESAMRVCRGDATYVAVSRHTARAWSHAVNAGVVLNGVDTHRWRPGPGGDRAVWSGRIVPEKAPHLAIRAAALAGIGIDLAGPRPDASYFDEEVRPLLGRHARYVGHLATDELVELVGSAAVAVISPAWEEPFGLVAAEAMACGTPVAAFDRGGLREIVTPSTGAMARPDDVEALATAITTARGLERSNVRQRAVDDLGVDTMVSGYECIYRQLCAGAIT